MLDFKDIKKGDLFSERANGLVTFGQALADPELKKDRYILTAVTDDNILKTYTQYLAYKEQGPALYPESFGNIDTRNIHGQGEELEIDGHFLSEQNSFLKGLILRVARLQTMNLDPKENPQLAKILGSDDYREVSRKHISTSSVIIYYSPILTKRLIAEASQGQHFFTGVGSRKTPAAIQNWIEKLSERLCRLGWGLRSGKALGADSAFQRGLERLPEDQQRGEIYLPWPDFNSDTGLTSRFDKMIEDPEAVFLASRVHPAWEQCKDSVRKLHTRNVYQVLGEDLKTPSKFVLYSAEEHYGVVTGGTATAVALARAFCIPAININHQDWKDKLLLALCGYAPRPVFDERVMGKTFEEVPEADQGVWLGGVLSYLMACEYLENYRELNIERADVLKSALSLWHLIFDPVKVLLKPQADLFAGWTERLFPEAIQSLAEQVAKEA